VDKIYELLKESVLIQGVMALTMLGTMCYMMISGMDVPDVLVGSFGTILGFYFGSKAVVQAQKKLP